MDPPGWLDVHGHFNFPMSESDFAGIADALRQNHFILSSPSQLQWTAENILKYNDSAGVTMQFLSYTPFQHEKMRAANDFGHEIVKKYPHRFGQLAALPTDEVRAALSELDRVSAFDEPKPDGFAVVTQYNDAILSDQALEPLWQRLDQLGSVVHVHPNAYVAGMYGKPSALMDVAFDTARVAADMLYKGVFRRYPNIKFIYAHCGGALPALSGRLLLLGTDPWVPNEIGLTRQEMETQLSNLYVDTAATVKTGLAPAIKMVGAHHCLYGADCGVPCSTEQTMNENMADIAVVEKDLGIQIGTIARRTWDLFPAARARARRLPN